MSCPCATMQSSGKASRCERGTVVTNSKKVSYKQVSNLFGHASGTILEDALYEWKECPFNGGTYAVGRMRPVAYALYVACDLLFRFPRYALTGKVKEYRVPENLTFGSAVHYPSTGLARR